jgi:hypothetical protein
LFHSAFPIKSLLILDKLIAYVKWKSAKIVALLAVGLGSAK